MATDVNGQWIPDPDPFSFPRVVSPSPVSSPDAPVTVDDRSRIAAFLAAKPLARTSSTSAPVDVSQPEDASLTYRPFESLMPKVREGLAAKQKAKSQDDADKASAAELADRQARAQMERDMSHAGALMTQGAYTSAGLKYDDAPFARGEQAAGQRVLDLLQQREQAKQATADRQAKDSADPTSNVSQQATLLARAQGLIGPNDSITATQFDQARQGAGVQAQREQAAANNKLAEANFGYQQLHDKQALAQQAYEAQAQRSLQRDLERSRADDAYRLHRMEAEEKRKASEKGKDLPPEAVMKFGKNANALSAIDRLEGLYKDAREHPLDRAKREAYEKASVGLSGTIAGGVYDKITAGDAKLLSEQAPGTILTPNKAGDEYFASLRNQIREDQANTAQGLRAQHYNVPADAVPSAGPSKPPPNGHATVKQNGVTYTWNPQTGQYE